MNYAQSQQDAQAMKEKLLRRRGEIVEEKNRLNRENGEIERQLVGLERVLEGLEFLSSDTPPEIATPGFTEEIRKTLQQTSVPLTAVQIRDTLLDAGVKHSSAKNLLISVHTVLGRLEDDLRKSEKDGKPTYIWKYRRRRHYALPGGQHRNPFASSSPTSWPLGPLPDK